MTKDTKARLEKMRLDMVNKKCDILDYISEEDDDKAKDLLMSLYDAVSDAYDKLCDLAD